MRRRLPTWRELHADDHPRIEAMQLAFYRDATPAAKLQLLESLRRQAIVLALGGLRLRHPNASPEQLQRRLADLLLGADLARRAYGPGPDENCKAVQEP